MEHFRILDNTPALLPKEDVKLNCFKVQVLLARDPDLQIGNLIRLLSSSNECESMLIRICNTFGAKNWLSKLKRCLVLGKVRGSIKSRIRTDECEGKTGGLPSEKRRMRKMERGKRRKARMMCTHR
jgi:hypothetical protein